MGLPRRYLIEIRELVEKRADEFLIAPEELMGDLFQSALHETGDFEMREIVAAWRKKRYLEAKEAALKQEE